MADAEQQLAEQVVALRSQLAAERADAGAQRALIARLEDENRALRRELDDARRARDDDDELGARLARLEAKLEDNARCGCGPSVARES